MRTIGAIKQGSEARRFANYMQTLGVEIEIRDDEDEFQVFVLDEDHVDRTEREFEAFQRDPNNAKYHVKSMRPAARDQAKNRFRQVDVRQEVFARPTSSQVPMTIGLILVSVLATYSTPEIKDLLSFSSFSFSRGMPEIMEGQIWRLVTPIFLHGNLMHLIFNMMWLFQLGGSIEVNEGKKIYVPFIIVTAIIAHLAQYYVSGPNFIGMSGVVYAMLGYVWMMSRYKPGSGYQLQQQIVVIMLVWMVICMTGMVGPIANTEHVAGMIAGTAIGFIRSGGMQTKKRQNEFQSKLRK